MDNLCRREKWHKIGTRAVLARCDCANREDLRAKRRSGRDRAAAAYRAGAKRTFTKGDEGLMRRASTVFPGALIAAWLVLINVPAGAQNPGGSEEGKKL